MDLEKFAKKIFELSDWPDGSVIDNGDLQDIAVECGLLTPETRYEPCGEECHCADCCGADEMRDGVTCYRKCELLLTTAPSADSEQTTDPKNIKLTIEALDYEAVAAFLESNNEAIDLAINLSRTIRRK